MRASAPRHLESIYDALGKVSFHHVDEAEMQDGVAAALEEAGVAFEREVCLSPRDRIDFLLDEGLGIECKVAGSEESLARQVQRYCESPRIRMVLVVTSTYRHTHLRRTLAGKPVETFLVDGL